MKVDYRAATDILKNAVGVTVTEEADIGRIYGRILAEDIKASENVPSFERSPYDGYAFMAADTVGASGENPVTLTVIEDIRAGQTAEKEVKTGTAIRLMTGAMIPEGADAVCKYEDTEYTDASVTIRKSYIPGDNVVKAGEDIMQGTLLAQKGITADAGLIGAMASLGITKARVYKRPLAGIISTGDELTDSGSIPEPGKIRNSNRYTIAAALEHIGYDTFYIGHAGDSIEETKSLIEKGYNECDVIISTGGVSAGDYDLVPDAMTEAGYEILLKGVGMKPGMACAYGVKGGKLMLALSGNPASSLTNLQCICYPALRKLAGYKEYDHKLIKVRLKDDCLKAGRGTRFLRGSIDINDGEAYLCAPTGQGNVVISSSIGCNAYGILTDMQSPVKSGTLIPGFFV